MVSGSPYKTDFDSQIYSTRATSTILYLAVLSAISYLIRVIGPTLTSFVRSPGDAARAT